LGTAVEVALAIIQGPSAEMSRGVIKRPGGNSRIIVCAGGPCTYGPGSVLHSLNHPNYLHLQKSALKWMDNLGSEAHRRNTVVDILCAGIFRNCRGFVQGCFSSVLGMGFAFEAELVGVMMAVDIAFSLD
jgi:hypothetical protein